MVHLKSCEPQTKPSNNVLDSKIRYNLKYKAIMHLYYHLLRVLVLFDMYNDYFCAATFKTCTNSKLVYFGFPPQELPLWMIMFHADFAQILCWMSFLKQPSHLFKLVTLVVEGPA